MKRLSNKQLAARIEPAIEMLLEARYLDALARKSAEVAEEAMGTLPSVQAYFNMRKVVAKMLGIRFASDLALALDDLVGRRERNADDGLGGSDAEFLTRRIRYWGSL